MKKINYTLTLKDCENYAKSQYKIKKTMKFFFKDNFGRAIIVSIILSFGLGYLMFGKINLSCIAVQIPLYILMAYFIWFCMFYFNSGKYIYRMLEGLDKSYEVCISEENISKTNKDGSSTFNWATIRDIYDTKHNYLIFISDRQAIIIPKRIFESNDEGTQFWELVKKYHNASR